MFFIRGLDWDDWNKTRIARHEVTPEEVEQVIEGEFIVRPGKQGRLLIIGPTLAARILLVVLEPEGEDIYYPVTARSVDRKERRIYREEKGDAAR